MFEDVRYALRTLLRAPGFAASAILALALGIGANTAVFSVIYEVLLKPLPFAEPERLVALYERNPAQGTDRGGVSPGTFVDWQARSHTLDSMAAFRIGSALWTFHGRSELVQVASVSPTLFSILRVAPLIGRTYTPADGERGGVVATRCGNDTSTAQPAPWDSPSASRGAFRCR